MRLVKIFLALVLIFNFWSCKKSSTSYDTTPTFYFVNGGSGSLNNSLVLFPAADSVTYSLVISSTFLPSQNVTITLGVADDERQSYNATNGTNYEAMPTNAYSFSTTILAGNTSTYDTIPVTLYKKYLVSHNYMLPIKILSVSNYRIDTSSASVLYLHTEDNSLSGIYASTIIKTLYNGDAINGNINSIDTILLSKNLIPLTDTSSVLDYADLGPNGWEYEVGFGVDGGPFYVLPNYIIQTSIQTGSFQVLASSFDPLTKNIYIKTSYKNVSGDERIVQESLTLQP